MTNNIIAHFSCSFYKQGDTIPTGKSVGDFVDYRVVSGSVFNEEYNETLDSGTIVLSQVPKDKRLFKIKPYIFVRVFDASGNTNFDKTYMVDNFDEKENNIKDHIFGYTINVMSQTKLLEKIQCPNLVITHTVVDGTIIKKSIYQYIKQYMQLYVPKIKYTSDGNTWSYQPLISIPAEGSEFYQRFNIPCADLSFNCPTLRQLLTTLMQQVGCIPVVKNRTLGFLDFQKDAVSFAIDGDYSLGNTVNFIRRSLSSDSYVNTLVNISENVLDSENEVICETLCFRDRNNVLLKQKENLCLETSFPIYKVNKCILRGPGKADGELISSYGCFLGCENYTGYIMDIFDVYKFPFIFYKEATISNGTASIKFRVLERISDQTLSPQVVVDYIYFWAYDSVKKMYKVVERRPFGTLNLSSDIVSSNYDSTEYYDQYADVFPDRNKTFTSYSYTKTFDNLDNSVVGFFISGSLYSSGSNHERKNFTFIKFSDSDHNVVYHDPYEADLERPGQMVSKEHVWSNDTSVVPLENRFVAAYPLSQFLGFQAWDISKLVVENSVRQLLDRDFQKMSTEISSVDVATIDNISKYVYGTVGYSIGSKTISGFSDVFNIGSQTVVGWIELDYTYLENIVRVLEKDTSSQSERILDVIYSHFEGLDTAYVQYQYFDTTPGTYPVSTLSNNVFWNSLKFGVDGGNALNASFEYYNPVTNTFTDTSSFYTAFFVDLYYQPLNSFNMSYVKSDEDVSLPLVQYDGNASGVTDFDRLSIHEQEQVDRIGNETLSIDQRTTDYSKIRDFSEGPLVFRDDVNRDGSVTSADNSVDYIIFKRSFSINNNCFNVSYVGSKDSVLKNYFTSIRTKYRAYQYVDYSQSVVRKERDVFYIRIASDYYNGDDKVFFGDIGTNQNTAQARGYLSNFIYDIENDKYNYGYERNVSYELETDIGKVHSSYNSSIVEEQQTIKNSVSVVSTDNMSALIYEYMDNVGAGPYIIDITDDANLGGIPQAWQIWVEDYNDKHTVLYASNIDYTSALRNLDSLSPLVTSSVKLYTKSVQKSPIVETMYFPYIAVFGIADDNTSNDYKRTFYKDVAERINHTVQFIYYAPNKDVLFNENFISGTPIINRYENRANYVLVSENEADFYNDKNLHERTSTERGVGNVIGTYFELVTDTTNGVPYLKTHWAGNMKVLKLCHRDETTGKFIDIVTFRRGGTGSEDIKFFFTINDTKTDMVFAEKEGLLYLRYEVDKYTSSAEENINRTCHEGGN